MFLSVEQAAALSPGDLLETQMLCPASDPPHQELWEWSPRGCIWVESSPQDNPDVPVTLYLIFYYDLPLFSHSIQS